jgi:hypothetical protein
MTIAIKPTASGSTIEQNGSTILTVDSSGNIAIANDLTVTGTPPTPDALSTASGSAPSYSARAWVNFNGSGTVAIRESGNVSSITDNGVGDYTVNFTTAMPDVNYSVASSSISTNDARGGAFVGVKATAVSPTDLDAQQYLLTSSVTIGCARGATASSNGVAEDSDSVSIIIFR